MSESSVEYGAIEAFAPGTYFGLGVLEHFQPKVYKDFELYQVFMYNFYLKLF